MPFFIILMIVFIGIVIYFKVTDDEAGLGFMVALIVVSTLYIIVSDIAINNKVQISNEYEEKIYNIQGLENNISNDFKIQGAFILGCGYIDAETTSEMKYYYFMVDEYGKKLESISGNDVYIRETSETEPCLIKTYVNYEFNDFFKWFLGENGFTKTEIKNILVVPENTIKIDYNVEI